MLNEPFPHQQQGLWLNYNIQVSEETLPSSSTHNPVSYIFPRWECKKLLLWHSASCPSFFLILAHVPTFPVSYPPQSPHYRLLLFLRALSVLLCPVTVLGWETDFQHHSRQKLQIKDPAQCTVFLAFPKLGLKSSRGHYSLNISRGRGGGSWSSHFQLPMTDCLTNNVEARGQRTPHETV